MSTYGFPVIWLVLDVTIVLADASSSPADRTSSRVLTTACTAPATTFYFNTVHAPLVLRVLRVRDALVDCLRD